MIGAKIRHGVVLFFLGLFLAGIVARLVQLMWVQRDFLLSQGDARSLRTVTIPAYRGMITDRNGEPLAVSTPVESLWVNPQKFSASLADLERLGRLIDVPGQKLKTLIETHRNREFLYLRRALSPPLAEQIRELHLPDVFFQREFHRFYPEGRPARIF